jgi:glutamate dehydrogenase (NAD(P)+)
MGREPLLTITYRDPRDGWEGMLVVDSLVGGVCGGGLRVTRTVDLTEVKRLARGMSRKNHMIGLPLGGAKSAIRYDPTATDLADALVRFFEHIRPICQTMYGWGPDMNTPPDLCDAVAARAGLKSRHMALAESSPHGYEGVARYDAALRQQVGPLSVTDLRTAVGVAGAVETAARVYEFASPLRVAIQGFGSVGMGTGLYLVRRGHQVVGVADASGTYRDPRGLDYDALLAAKHGRRELERSALDARLYAGDPMAILDTECDVLVLAAIPDAVTADNVDRLRCKMIVEGGNFAIAPSAYPGLAARGIQFVPDFVASGGAIATVGGIIQLGWNAEPEALLGEIEQRVSKATHTVASEARSRNISMRDAALLHVPADFRD